MPRAPIDRSVAAADRALKILEAFGKAGGQVQTLDALEQETGLFKSVICRYLLSFERYGYVAKVAEGKYQLGTAVLRLGRAFERAFDMSQQVMPILEHLSRATRESASYYVQNNDKRLCLYRVDSPYSLRVSVQPGKFLPMDQSASAQVLREYSGGLESAGPPSSWVKVKSNAGPERFASMSAPVFGVEGQLAGALTLSGPSSRFNPSRDPAARNTLLAAALSLSAKLGAPNISPAPANRVSGHRSRKPR